MYEAGALRTHSNLAATQTVLSCEAYDQQASQQDKKKNILNTKRNQKIDQHNDVKQRVITQYAIQMRF